MTARDLDPLRLDVQSFAKQDGELQGQWPIADLTRLPEMLPDAAPGSGEGASMAVNWRAQGACRPVRGGPPQTWLHLQARASVALQCQRCLGAVIEDLNIDRHILFVADEAAAEKLDAELEDDVMVMTRALNLRDLVEDELLLALPLVPRHEQCPKPLPLAADVTEPLKSGADKPFAALAALKVGRKSS
jgi:uncharacterized protein